MIPQARGAAHALGGSTDAPRDRVGRRFDSSSELDQSRGRLPESRRVRVFYRIGEVAALVGVSAQVLRHWEEVLGLPQPMKTRGSHRHYRRHDVEQAMRVRSLLDTGLTLRGVKLALDGATPTPTRDVRANLVSLRAELEALRELVRAPQPKGRRARVVPASDP